MPTMLPVSASELANIQSFLVDAVCDQTCQIYRDTGAHTPDAYGSSTSSPTNTGNYTLVATTVAGMQQPQSTHLQNYAFEIEAEDTWLVHFPVGQDVRARDHAVIGGQTLEIHILLSPQSYPGLLSVLAAELK